MCSYSSGRKNPNTPINQWQRAYIRMKREIQQAIKLMKRRLTSLMKKCKVKQGILLTDKDYYTKL